MLGKKTPGATGMHQWNNLTILKEQISPGSKRISNKTFRKTVQLKIAKQTVRTSTRLWKMSVRTLWRGQPLLK
jgi:hypothetical protein